MRISIGQINPVIADFDGNSEKIVSFARKARDEQKADLVLFPELALCGFPPLDLLEREHFAEIALNALHALERKIPAGIAVGLGYIKRNPYAPEGAPLSGQADGPCKPLVNVYGIILDGKIVFEQIKTRLPRIDGFDQAKYFEPAREWNVFDYGGERIGFAFACDTAREPASRDDDFSPPLAALKQQGISLLCVPSAARYAIRGRDFLKAGLEQTARGLGVPLVYVNAAGANGEVILDGRSFAVIPGAEGSLYEAKAFEEDQALWVFDKGRAARNRAPALSAEQQNVNAEPAAVSSPVEGPLSPRELDMLEKALVLGIKDYMKKSGFTRAHLGLSGGIDSSLVAYLAVRAAGPDNVACFSMPSRFSSRGSKDDAAEQAAILGCRYETLPIENCYSAFLSTLEGVFEKRPFDVAEENLQSRIRGVLLMAFSNKWNSMLLTTGNKSEIAMGYCTLYGDTNGALAPIGDLFKTEVFALCRRINERSIAAGGRAMIPQAIIDKPPSAELRPDQKDEDSLPPYEILDGILRLYLCEKLSQDEIAKKGWDRELAGRIIKTTARTEWKRRQLPPALWVSSRPFGAGRQLPLVRVIQGE